MHIFCDFDGTISLGDTTDMMLDRFAHPSWRQVEEEWKAGEIGSAECMRRQIQLIEASREELDQALDAVEIDPGFKGFMAFCESFNLPVSILSDGVQYFIQRILKRHGVHGLQITANLLYFCGDNRYTLASPNRAMDCASRAGVCKCRAVAKKSELRVFIGDGRSDFCASDKADVVFAKGALAVYCEQHEIAYTAYETFEDVTVELSKQLIFIDHLSDMQARLAVA